MAVKNSAEVIVQCLNTDTKPTTGYSPGTLLKEITEATYSVAASAKFFSWNGSAWVEMAGVNKSGLITLGNKSYATIQAAMNDVTTSNKIIILGPGTYTEDITWSDVTGVKLLEAIKGTVVVQALTASAISINPAAASGTWEATIGVGIKHATGKVGILLDNEHVGKRINLYLNDVDIDSQAVTDISIDVNRSGPSTDAIRIYANGHGNTIEGLVDYITESSDDRVRFWGYRLVGGITITGAVAMELTLACCGIKTSGLTVNATNVYNLIACYYETDANPNVHTACVDAVEQ